MAAIHARGKFLIIAIVGPESSGKTSLAMSLSDEFSVPWLAEYAREYLSGRPEYTEDDLHEIARGQADREEAIIAAGGPLVILDTDLVVIAIWWQEKFGLIPGWVSEYLDRQTPRHYFLMHPDLAWEPDPLRVSPGDRDRLFGCYHRFLVERDFLFTEISGTGRSRVESAVAALRRLQSHTHVE